MSEIMISTRKDEDMARFLMMQGFEVEDLGSGVTRAQREGELPVFLKATSESIFFEVDLGNVAEIASEKLYFDLLDLNTEILPVSVGFNNANPEDPRLVLVESREIGDLNDHEILSVFDALELAADRLETLLGAELSR